MVRFLISTPSFEKRRLLEGSTYFDIGDNGAALNSGMVLITGNTVKP